MQDALVEAFADDDRVVLWLMNVQDTFEWAYAFVGQAAIEDTPTLMDEDGSLFNGYDKGESDNGEGAPFPWHVVVDHEGVIAFAQGNNDPDALVQAVEEVLGGM